jgi:hypothetical protein
MSAASRLEQVCFLLGVSLGGEDGTPPSVAGYDSYYDASVTPFLEICNSSENKEIKNMGVQIETAFKAQRAYLYAATVCAKPTPEEMMAALAPIGAVVGKAGEIPRRTKVVDHHRAFEQAIQCVNWLCIDGGSSHVLAQRDAADFYLNKVLRFARDLTDDGEKKLHRAYVSTLKKMLTDLAEYASNFHKQGIIWKFGGANIAEFKEPTAESTAANRTEEDRLDAAVAALEAYAARMSGGDGDGAPPAIAAWQELIATELKAFTDAASSPELKLDAKIVEGANQAFAHTGRVIEASLECKKPNEEKFGAFLGPISSVLGSAGDPPRGAQFDFAKGYGEMISVLAWVCMDGAGDYIQSQIDASAFSTNKVLRLATSQEDGKKAAMRTYVNSLKALGTAVKAYTQEWFKQGLIWRGQSTELPAEFTHFPQ